MKHRDMGGQTATQNNNIVEDRNSRWKRERRRRRCNRAIAGVLTAVMCVEALLGGGVSTAIAESMSADAEWQQTADALAAANGSEANESGGTSGSGSSTSASSATGGASGENSASSSTSSTSSSESGDRDSSSDTSGVSSGSAASDASGNTAIGESSDGGDAASTGDANTAVNDDVTLVARDWTSATDALVLGSEGLSWDDSVAALAQKIASADDEARTQDAATYGTAAAALEDVVLPAALPASLNIRARLDATAGAGRTGDGAAEHNKLVAGDTFTIELPAKVSADLTSSKLSANGLDRELTVYARDAATGKAGAVKVGSAKVYASKLVVTVCDPVNTQTGVPETLGSSIDAVIDLDVSVDASLVGDEEHDETWTLQTLASGASRTAALSIPSKRDLAVALGLLTGKDASSVAATSLADGASDDADDPKKGDIKYEVSGATSAQEFTTRWADNNSADRPSAADLQARNEYRLYYSLDGGATKKALTTDGVNLTDEAKADLHIDSLEAYGSPLVTVDNPTSGAYVATSSDKLPSKVTTKELTDITTDEETGEPVYNWTTTDTQNVTYYIKHEVAGADAVPVEDSALVYPDSAGTYEYQVLRASTVPETEREKYAEDFEVETILLLETVTFTFKLNIGSDLYDADGNLRSADELAREFAPYQTLHTAGGTTDDMKLSQMLDDGFVTATWDADGDGVLTMRLPLYYPDGTPNVYSLVQESHDTTAADGTWGTLKDTYQIWYDNSATVSYGSRTDAAYSGGTVTITHAGTTKYSSTKKWLDTDASDRPATTYTLWRYADDGTSDWSRAAQVSAGGSFVEFTISAADNQAAGAEGIDLGAKLKEVLGDNTLPKYDPNGYPYVYALREDAPSGYERLYGSSVVTDTSSSDYGSVKKGTDTKPNYYGVDGTTTADATVAEDTRPSGDRGVYNNGTLINRRTDTVAPTATKTWICGSYQDQLKDVKVTFTLRRLLKAHATKDEDGNWTPNGDTYDSGDPIGWADTGVSKELSGWNAESLSKQLTAGGMPRYDAEGNEYVYRWFETNVESDTEDKVWVLPSSDGGVDGFLINFTDENGAEDPVWFNVSTTVDAKTGATTITNRYESTASASIDKYWAKLDENGEAVTDENGKIVYEQAGATWGSAITVSLVQTGTSGSKTVGTFTLDGRADATPTSFSIDGTYAQYQETSAWHMEFTNLPKYNENGSKYTYMVFESAGNYHSDSSYNAEKNATTVYNRPATDGESTRLNVTKSWTDGGNTSSRVPVKVGVYAKHDMASSDGKVSYAADQLITTTTLDASNGWYAEVYVGIGGLDAGADSKDLYIRELSNGKAGSEASTVVTRDEALQDAGTYGDVLRNWGETNGKNAYNERMFTDAGGTSQGFCYEVTYGYNSTLNAFEVNNRRLGQVWLKIDKEWEDSGHEAGSRPVSYFTVGTSSASDVSFEADENGNIYAQVTGGNKLALYTYDVDGDSAGDELSPLTTDAAAVSADGLSLRIRIDAATDNTSYPVVSLPKYNRYGGIIDYTVAEGMSNAGDYTSSNTDTSEGFDSEWHFKDTLNYTFTNTRSGTKDVTFCTRWYDDYVKSELGQRPDLFLTVYKTVYDYNSDGSLKTDVDGKPVVLRYDAVTGYENYRWRATSSETSAGVTNEQATIKSLPKYDGHGKEIFYYAVASLNVSASVLKSLDYTDPWITTALNADATAYEQGNKIWDEHNESDPERTHVADTCEVASSTAVREDGTFNFGISSKVAADGIKLWKDLPNNFAASDLPHISIYLQRRLAGSSTAWSRPSFVKDSSELGYSVSPDDLADVSGSDVADGKTVVAYTNDLTFVSTNRYKFALSYYGKNGVDANGNATGETGAAELPKYDENGRRYEYRAIEVVDGLIDKAGGFKVDELNGWDASQTGDPDNVYVSTMGSGAYSFTNTYGPETGKLTVKKIYSKVESDDMLPDTTFSLYRYYVKSDGTKSASARVAQKTLKASDLTDGEGTLTFTDVEKYAPNGDYWVYYVVETGIDGYETTVALGNAATDDDGYKDAAADDAVTGGKRSPDLVNAGEAQGEDGATAYTAPATTPVADDETPDVTFKNSYTPQSIAMGGTKIWLDQQNVAGTRPTSVEITLKRAYADGTADASLANGVVELQTTDAAAANYLQWSTSDTDNWTYTISNIEMWAPNGKKWTYTVSENESSLASTDYYIVKNGGKATAANGAKLPDISNGLTVEVTPKKVWQGDDDVRWAQRPTFYYQLQARLAGTSGAWTEAGSLLSNGSASAWTQATLDVGDGKTLSGYVLPSGGSTVGFLEPNERGKDWTGETWKYLPSTVLRGDTSYKVEYRVVEKYLVYDKDSATPTVVELADPDSNGSYGDADYYPYNPSLNTVSSADGAKTVYTSTMTNTLTAMSLTLTKTWDDQENAWHTRPGTSTTSDTWSVSYALQRSTDGGASWNWVTTYGGGNVTDATALNEDGTFNAKLRTVVLQGVGESATTTLSNLPASDTAGHTYTYRMVERVTGSYSATGVEIADAAKTVAGGTVRLVAVTATSSAGATPSALFTNSLNAVKVSGTKAWDDAGSGLAPAFADAETAVSLRLERSADGVSWVTATKADGAAAQVVWSKTDDAHWTFTFSDLPKSDQAGVTYRYRVLETGAGSNGFIATYGDDASVDGTTGDVSAGTITNTATKFTLNKIGDATTGSAGESLNDVTLKIRANGKTYGIWTRDASGNVSTYVSQAGVPEGDNAESNLSAYVSMTGEAAGCLVGIPAGTYSIHESKVPAGHVRAGDIKLVIKTDGTVTAAGKALAGDVPTATVTDEVFRGNVELAKYFKHDGTKNYLEGMTFDLYKCDDADGTNPVRVATGISTVTRNDAAGRNYSWATKVDACKVTYDVDASTGVSVLGKYFVDSMDGLPYGYYYFKETGISPYVVESEATKVFKIQGSDGTGEKKQSAFSYEEFENTEFNAAAQLIKVDSETGTGVNGAAFTLEYWAEGVDAAEDASLTCEVKSGKNYTFDATMTDVEDATDAEADGRLELTGLKKGSYRLTETANTGYSVGTGDAATVASWTIDDDDQEHGIDLGTDEDVAWTNAAFKNGGIANTPLHGSISLKKVSSENPEAMLDGAVFKLQKKDGGDWAAVAGADKLTTGAAYEAAVDANGSITGITKVSDTSGSGTILLSNLPWGTYRFVEVTPTAGYVIGGDGTCTTDGITIDAQNVAATQTTPLARSVTNEPSGFELYKTNGSGSTKLAGATFTVEGDFTGGHAIKTLVTVTGTGKAEAQGVDDDLVGQMVMGNTYTITETVAPAGYTVEPSSAVLEVKLEATGELSVVGTTPEGWTLSAEDGVMRISKSDELSSVSILKRDAENSPLLGSAFTVSGKIVDGATSAQGSIAVTPEGDNAIASLEGKLVAGEVYTVSETTYPLGYAKLPDVQVKALADGKLAFVSENHDGWSLDENGHALVAKDAAVNFTLKKTDAVGNALVNATFGVEGTFVDDAAAATASDATRDFTVSAASTDKGTVQVEGVLAEGTAYVDADGTARTASGDYIVSEKTAPYGYVKSTESFAIHVAADGTVTAAAVAGVENGASYELCADTKTLTLEDESIALSFKKVNAAGDELDGARFDITGRFASATGELKAEETLYSQSCAELASLKFAQGQTYTIKEVAAPAGYKIIGDKHTGDTATFTVGENGAITEIAGATASSYVVDDDGLTLKALDEPITLAVTKKSEDGKALSGATFRLVPYGRTFADGTTTELTLETDENGVAQVPEAQLVGGESYILSEIKAPAGYQQITGSYWFSMGKDGLVSGFYSDTSANGTIKINANGLQIDVTDKVVPFDLVKYSSEGFDKQGAAGTPLSGATFSVTPADGYSFADGDIEPISFTTGEDGHGGSAELTGKLVVGSRYLIQETQAPEGYKLVDGVLEVVVNADGTLAPAGEAPAAYQMTFDGALAVFTGDVTNDPTRLVVRKVSSENALLGLAGATFTLEPVDDGTFADGSTKAKTVTTSGNQGENDNAEDSGEGVVAGWAEFDRALLRANGKTVYELTETVAPWGFALSSYKLRFTVGTDGTVTPLDADEAAAAGYTVTDDGFFTVTAADVPTNITVKKASQGGEALGGATFELACAEGESEDGEANHFANGSSTDVKSLTSGEDGTLAIAGELVAGNTYTLTETAPPDGYGLITVNGGAEEAAFTFTVRADGTIERVSGPDAYVVGDDGVSIEVTDTVIDLRLQKLASDEADASAMAGAVFSVTPEGKGSTFAGGATEAIVLTTGKRGFTESLAGKLVVGSGYRVSELVAPAGYKLLAQDLVIAVAEDGSISVVEDDAAAAAADKATAWKLTNVDGVYTLSATDDPVHVELCKVDENDATRILANAEFTLAGAFATGRGETKDQTRKLVTAADGTLGVSEKATDDLCDLVAGETYTLTETKAPEGYELDSTPFVFTVGTDGSISVAKGHKKPENVTLAKSADGNARIVVSNKVEVIEPASSDAQKKGSQKTSAQGLVATGDSQLLAVSICATLGLLAIAEGLRRLRSRL